MLGVHAALRGCVESVWDVDSKEEQDVNEGEDPKRDFGNKDNEHTASASNGKGENVLTLIL